MPINCGEPLLQFDSIHQNMAPSVSETITQTVEHVASSVGKLNVKDQKIVDVRRKVVASVRNND